MIATSQSVVDGLEIKFMKQHLSLPLLFEAKQIFFDGKIEKNRVRSNVLKRMAFCNAFNHYATKINMGAVIGKNHSTVIHYNKQHEWHSKYCNEYIEYYTVAEALVSQYVTTEEDFGGLDKPVMVGIIRDLRHTLNVKQVEINNLNQIIKDLSKQIKDAEDAKWNIKTYSAL